MRWWLPALVAAVVLAGCTDEKAPTPDASLPSVALDFCPSSTAVPGTGGKRLPSLTLKCLDQGPEVDLAALGKPYLLNMWASWCEPCRSEMPALQKIYRDLAGRMGVLGVNIRDSPRPARETIQSTAVTYPSVVDKDEKLRDELLRIGVSAVGAPITVLVRADGTIPDGGVLIGEQTEAELRAAIGKHLGVAS